MRKQSQQLIVQALRLSVQALKLVVLAVEDWDRDDDEPPDPTRLVDQDQIADERTKAELRRLGLL